MTAIPPTNPPGELSREIAKLLEGPCECMDRIWLLGCFALGSTGGGRLRWWNALTGGAPPTGQKLRGFAGTFSRRVRARAEKNRVPVVDFGLGDKTKHEQAEKLPPKDPRFRGRFATFVARAPAPIRQACSHAQGKVVLYRPKRWPPVNRFYFHLLDPPWERLTIRSCASALSGVDHARRPRVGRARGGSGRGLRGHV